MKVTMYKANDGSLHETQKACDAKNVELRTTPLVEEFVNGIDPNAAFFLDASNDPITSGIFLDLADLPAFIVRHADALRTLLNKAVNPVGRPRKGSADATKQRKPRADKGSKRTAQPEPKPDQVAKAPAADPLDDVLAGLGE
jgi:hypothetical protein